MGTKQRDRAAARFEWSVLLLAKRQKKEVLEYKTKSIMFCGTELHCVFRQWQGT